MKTMQKWDVIENFGILVFMAFLCWLFTSGWPCLLLLAINMPKEQP